MASEASSASNLDDAPPPSEIPRQDGSGAHGAGHDPKGHGFLALALGSIGVVFGDIGTSPLYALREALAHSRASCSAVGGPRLWRAASWKSSPSSLTR